MRKPKESFLGAAVLSLALNACAAQRPPEKNIERQNQDNLPTELVEVGKDDNVYISSSQRLAEIKADYDLYNARKPEHRQGDAEAISSIIQIIKGRLSGFDESKLEILTPQKKDRLDRDTYNLVMLFSLPDQVFSLDEKRKLVYENSGVERFSEFIRDFLKEEVEKAKATSDFKKENYFSTLGEKFDQVLVGKEIYEKYRDVFGRIASEGPILMKNVDIDLTTKERQKKLRKIIEEEMGSIQEDQFSDYRKSDVFISQKIADLATILVGKIRGKDKFYDRYTTDSIWQSIAVLKALVSKCVELPLEHCYIGEGEPYIEVYVNENGEPTGRRGVYPASNHLDTLDTLGKVLMVYMYLNPQSEQEKEGIINEAVGRGGPGCCVKTPGGPIAYLVFSPPQE